MERRGTAQISPRWLKGAPSRGVPARPRCHAQSIRASCGSTPPLGHIPPPTQLSVSSFMDRQLSVHRKTRCGRALADFFIVIILLLLFLFLFLILFLHASLPRGEVRLQTSCSKGFQNPTPCWTRHCQMLPKIVCKLVTGCMDSMRALHTSENVAARTLPRASGQSELNVERKEPQRPQHAYISQARSAYHACVDNLFCCVPSRVARIGRARLDVRRLHPRLPGRLHAGSRERRRSRPRRLRAPDHHL